jgi:hypothetical protein
MLLRQIRACWSVGTERYFASVALVGVGARRIVVVDILNEGIAEHTVPDDFVTGAVRIIIEVRLI